jgi:hypothetical protein
MMNPHLMSCSGFTNALMRYIEDNNLKLGEDQLYSCVKESENFSSEARKFFANYFMTYVLSKEQLSFDDWHGYLIDASIYFADFVDVVRNIVTASHSQPSSE